MKLREDGSHNIRWILITIGVIAGVYLGFRYLLPLVLPFLAAYFLAWLIRPVTETLYRRLKIPRIVGGSFSLILLIAVFGTSFCMLINILIKQAITFIRNLPIYLNVVAGKLDRICVYCDDIMGLNSGSSRGFVDENITQTINKVKTDVIPELTQHTISVTIKITAFLGILLIVFIAAVLIAKDLPEFHKHFENSVLYQDIHKVTSKLSEVGMAYLRTQLIIMVMIAGICILGLSLIKNEYAALLGIGIALMDALPILGSGIILVPWTIIMLLNGNIYAGAILITTYLLCQVVREVLEPKLIGNRIGVKPLLTLMSMYVGLRLFSIAGVLLGPIGLVIIQTILKVLHEREEEGISA